MISTCECVALGHPDRTADAITSYILDAYLRKDPKTRYAVECQIKDNYVTLAGEVTSKANFMREDIAALVRSAIHKIGYTSEYAWKWPKGATLDADKVVVQQFIGQQSPNIAQGVDRGGWGDQGVFCGMAVNDEKHGYMPLDRYYSHAICDALYNAARNGIIPIGLDIKTQVTTDENFVCEVIVAAPMQERDRILAESKIRKVISGIIPLGCGPDKVIINGTGSYVIHSSVGDAGTTGRKLAVDFYGLNCPIGGGAPWSKDGTKADVALNLLARYEAIRYIKKYPKMKQCIVKISCCIGRDDVWMTYFDEHGDVWDSKHINISQSDVIKLFDLRQPVFFGMCRDGLFSIVDRKAVEDKNLQPKTHTKKRNNQMKQVGFKPVASKKDAQKNLTAALVLCKECKKQFVSITKLNTCFGLKSKGGEMAAKAVEALRIKPVLKGTARYLTKDDARKVIDFVYGHKAK